MRAAIIEHYKQATPTLTDRPTPTPGPNTVLVKVHAASINPVDLKIMSGALRPLLHYQMPLTLGSDFAGVITAVGSGVRDWAVGDAVFGRVSKQHIGTFAEYHVVAAADIAEKPVNLSFEEAASLPLVALTSMQALHDVLHLQAGQQLFIPGGAGGIGTVALQLAKIMGVAVTTTASPKHFALLKQLGATRVYDYHTTPITALEHEYDAVFDTRGGQDLLDSFGIVKPGGRVVSIAGVPDARFAQDNHLPWWQQRLFALASHRITRASARAGVPYTFLFMHPSGAQLAHIADLWTQGRLQAVVDRVLPLSAIADAFAYVQAGHATGKVVLSMEAQHV